jgi:hypothetical protein
MSVIVIPVNNDRGLGFTQERSMMQRDFYFGDRQHSIICPEVLAWHLSAERLFACNQGHCLKALACPGCQ